MPMPPGMSSSPLRRTPSANPAGLTERIASITRCRNRIRFSKEPPKLSVRRLVSGDMNWAGR